MGDVVQQSGVYRHEDGDLEGKYDWRLVAGGNVVATSGNQGYEKHSEALRMFERVVGGAFAEGIALAALRESRPGG